MQEGAKTQMLQTLPGQLHILLHEGFRQDVQHRLPDPVLSQSAFGFQANVLQTVADTLTVLQQGELPAGGISRLFCEHIQGNELPAALAA